MLQARERSHVLWHFAKNGISGILLCLISACGVILMHASKKGGEYPYNFSAVILLAEGSKLVISSMLLWRELKMSSSHVIITKSWRVSVLYLIPGIIYAVQNNIQFMIVKHVEPMTYELFRNINIISTACVSRILLKRALSTVQWVALLLMTIGMSTSQLTCLSAAYGSSVRGGVWALMSALLSAFAGVYTERVMKQIDDSVHWQNAQLYMYGLVCNSFILVCRNQILHDSASVSPVVLFKNFGLSAVRSQPPLTFCICKIRNPLTLVSFSPSRFWW
jgi:UDP-sugar transporter A1/2/3